jgi:predicted aspartyl protease
MKRNLSSAMMSILINNTKVEALIDTGSTNSFITQKLANSLNLVCSKYYQEITMASTSVAKAVGKTTVTVTYKEEFVEMTLIIMPLLCADVILGHDFLHHHSALKMPFNGTKSTLKICSLAAASVSPPSLFLNLTPDVHPDATLKKTQNSLKMKYRNFWRLES